MREQVQLGKTLAHPLRPKSVRGLLGISDRPPRPRVSDHAIRSDAVSAPGSRAPAPRSAAGAVGDGDGAARPRRASSSSCWRMSSPGHPRPPPAATARRPPPVEDLIGCWLLGCSSAHRARSLSSPPQTDARSRHRWSPILAARAVDPAMSVNKMVARTRSVSRTVRAPVRNSPPSRMASVSPTHGK